MNAAPKQPWYRHPWPWLLMAGPGLVIVAGVVTSVVAFRGADGVVSDDYYKLGLAINRTLARESRAAELGINARLRFEADAVAVAITAREALPERIQLTLAHPTRANADRIVILTRGADGSYRAPLPALAAGRWRAILETPQWRWSALAVVPG